MVSQTLQRPLAIPKHLASLLASSPQLAVLTSALPDRHVAFEVALLLGRGQVREVAVPSRPALRRAPQGRSPETAVSIAQQLALLCLVSPTARGIAMIGRSNGPDLAGC
jgi:hypothetical protein